MAAGQSLFNSFDRLTGRFRKFAESIVFSGVHASAHKAV
jgi:hypothetical protein